MRTLFLMLSFIISFSLPFSAKAKKEETDKYPKKLLEIGDWRAFVSQENGKKICYMLSFPLKQEGDYKKRGKTYLMITHRPEDKSLNVVSFHAGYKFSKESKPRIIVSIGTKKNEYELFVEDESAWAASDELDKILTTMITKTDEGLIIKGESVKGTKTSDTFSLKGSFGAYKAICEACKVKL